MLGALACPNLPLASISSTSQHPSQGEVGCLFFANIGAGTYIQLLNSSSASKVSTGSDYFWITVSFLGTRQIFYYYCTGASHCNWQSWRSIILWIIWSSTLLTWFIQLNCKSMFTFPFSLHPYPHSSPPIICLFWFVYPLKRQSVDRNLVSKHQQLELIARLSMVLYLEEMGQYICASLIKVTVKKYGIMLLDV